MEAGFIMMEAYMKGIWKEIRNKEKEMLIIKMSLCIRENGKMTFNL